MMTTQAPPKPELLPEVQATSQVQAIPTTLPAVETVEMEVADKRFDAKWPLNCDWPREIGEAYRRGPGPYTVKNVTILLEEEPLELYNGWLVWQEMTDAVERRVAANIQEILSIVARTRGFGRGYPDQVECYLANENVIKPDVCIISDGLFEEKVRSVKKPDKDGKHMMLHGAPELVVEIRSPSNRRTKEKLKRQDYFDNGTQVIWDVEPKKQIIWVYEATRPDQSLEYKGKAEISCEVLFPGWKRKASDFFSKSLTAEQIVGDEAAKWRAESRSEGRAEGELATLRQIIMLQVSTRFPDVLASRPDLEAILTTYTVAELTGLLQSFATSTSAAEWLATLPA